MEDHSPSNSAEIPPPGHSLEQRPFGLRRADQRFIAFVVAVCLVLLTIYVLSPGPAGWVDIERLPQSQAQYRLDVNDASWVEWAQLEGIGEALARRIVEYREEHGPFSSIDDLTQVRGIGPKTLDRVRPWVEIGHAARPAGRSSPLPDSE